MFVHAAVMAWQHDNLPNDQHKHFILQIQDVWKSDKKRVTDAIYLGRQNQTLLLKTKDKGGLDLNSINDKLDNQIS